MSTSRMSSRSLKTQRSLRRSTANPGGVASHRTRGGREQWSCRHCGRSFGEDFTRCCAHEQQCRGLTRS
ncbi:MAG: hypothetical protein ACR2NH_11470 [Solirubrobacteraceae bacterium]